MSLLGGTRALFSAYKGGENAKQTEFAIAFRVISSLFFFSHVDIYIPYRACLKAEVGKQTFFKSPQIANLQILGLIPLSQISKILMCVSPQIANPQIFMINPQVANLQISAKQCTILSHTIPKSSFILFYTKLN
jgi:hypothetical protein